MSTATAPGTPKQEFLGVSGPLSRYIDELPSRAITVEAGAVSVNVGRVIDALIMPAGFGGEVNRQLMQAMLRVPIIVVPGSRTATSSRWVFLTRPRTQMRPSTLADLVSAQVGWYEVGAAIPLPGSGSTGGGPRWVQRPEAGLELPEWGAVVGAVRRTFSRAW